MKNEEFSLWCQTATGKIRYGPDREAVSKELRDHLEDHYDALTGKGLSPAEAEAQTLAAMGSAEEIAPQLAAVHKPWLGYLSTFIKVSAIITAVLAIFSCVSTYGSFLHTLVSARNFDFIPVNHGPLDYYDHPKVSDWCDGYRFRVTEVGHGSHTPDVLYLELEVTRWPWLPANAIIHRIWAMDSLGNYYECRAEAAYDDPTRVYTSGFMGSSLIGIYDMLVMGFDTDAEWVELHYDREGRDMTLRIDLTGGGQDG